jgi:hypothetical protein
MVLNKNIENTFINLNYYDNNFDRDLMNDIDNFMNKKLHDNLEILLRNDLYINDILFDLLLKDMLKEL